LSSAHEDTDGSEYTFISDSVSGLEKHV